MNNPNKVISTTGENFSIDLDFDKIAKDFRNELKIKNDLNNHLRSLVLLLDFARLELIKKISSDEHLEHLVRAINLYENKSK